MFYPEANKYLALLSSIDDDWMSEPNSEEDKKSKIEIWKSSALEICRALYHVMVSEPDALYNQWSFAVAATVTLENLQMPQIASQNTAQSRELRAELKKLRQLPQNTFLKLQYLLQIHARTPRVRSVKDYATENLWHEFWDQLALRNEKDRPIVLVTDQTDRAWLLKTYATNPTPIKWEDLPSLVEDLQFFKRIRRDRKWKNAEANLDSYNADKMRIKLRPFRPKGLSIEEFEELLSLLRLPFDRRSHKKRDFLQKLEGAGHVSTTRNRVRRALEASFITDDDVRLIYKGNDGLIISPMTETGARIVGMLTSWCTSYENTPTAFIDYTSVTPLWVFILPDGDKYQLSLNDNAFHDATDVPIEEASPSLRALGAHLPREEFDQALSLCPPTSLARIMRGLTSAQLAIPFVSNWAEENLSFFALMSPLSSDQSRATTADGDQANTQQIGNSFVRGIIDSQALGLTLKRETIEKALNLHAGRYSGMDKKIIPFTKELGLLQESFPLSSDALCDIVLTLAQKLYNEFHHNFLYVLEHSSLYPAIAQRLRHRLIYKQGEVPDWLAEWARADQLRPTYDASSSGKGLAP